MNKQREQAEELIYNVMDKLDKTGQNTQYYKNLFMGMSDAQFLQFCKRDLPFRFHTKPFEIEPKMSDAKKALNLMGVPLLEKVSLPYLYENSDGVPVTTDKAFVAYLHIKKMKQFITKKNAMSTSKDERDMKTGLLVSFDKNGKTSDAEMNSLAVMGLDHTLRELSTWRADYMDAKSDAYQTINTLGDIKETDIDIEVSDSLSKSLLNCYLLGSGLYTNMINVDYMLPSTLSNKTRKVEREV